MTHKQTLHHNIYDTTSDRRLPGGSDHFSLQTNTQTDTHHNTYITLPAIIIQLNDHHQYLHHHPHISLIIIITFNFTNNTSLTLLPGCIISASISNSSSLLNCDCATFTEQTERKVGGRANYHPPT